MIDEAFAAFQSHRTGPEQGGAWSIGAWLGRLDDLDKALADFSKAIELDPKSAMAWNNRGLVYSKLGQVDKASPTYSKAIELDPSRDGLDRPG